MRQQLALVFLPLCAMACQAPRTTTALAHPSPAEVWVQGTMYYPHDSIPLKGFEAVFVPAGAAASPRIVADMVATGYYRIRLPLGQPYIIRLLVKDRNCVVEMQEFAVPAAPTDTVLTKNFYMSYPDSTAYGGCLAG